MVSRCSWTWVLAGLIAAGCGGDHPPTGGPDTPDGPDGVVLGDGDTLVGVDAPAGDADAGDADAGDADAGDAPDPCLADPGGFGCACDDNVDCDSGWCIPSRLGDQVCSQTCSETCPGDLACRLVQRPGADPVFLCVDPTVDLCRPCRSNKDCQGDFGAIDNRCIPRGPRDGAFCGLGCARDEDCPGGYACAEVTDLEAHLPSLQCVPQGGAACTCSKRAIAEQASTACGDVACAGRRVCGPDGLTGCDAPTARTETCDGRDDNCNGSTDEGFANTDGDGLADCVDPDDDGDGRPDDLDGCPLVADPGQEDRDGDGVGDACDPPDAPRLLETVPAAPADDARPQVLGAAQPGTVLALFAAPDCGGQVVGDGVTGADGAFAVAATVPEDALTVLRAVATDPLNGLTSGCSDGLVYIEDSTAPAAPVLAETEPRSPSPATAVVVRGRAEPFARVTVHDDGACSEADGPSAVADASGAFAIAVSVAPDAETTFIADARDAAQHRSACSAGLAYVADATAPAPPVLEVTIPPSPSADERRPVLVGVAEPGATVAIFAAPGCAGPTVNHALVGDNGLFTARVDAAADATTTFTATATDAAGNTSACAVEGLAYTHDDLAPDPPALLGTDPGSPGATTTPEVFGTAEPLARVRLFLDPACAGLLVGDVAADALGDWRVTVAVPADRTTLVYGRATDRVGHDSACSEAPLAYVHDGRAPAAPELRGTAPRSPSASPTFAVEGVAEAGATVDLWTDPACTAAAAPIAAPDPAKADPDGRFAVPVAARDNAALDLWATATDAAQNRSPCSLTSARYVHDDRAPDPPALAATRPASPASELAPRLGGTAEPRAALDVFGDPACADAVLGTGAAADDGTFSVAVAVAAERATTLFATATDAAGNRSACAAPGLVYVHDGSLPFAPRLVATDPPSPSRASLAPTFRGEAEAGSTVALFDDATCADPARADVTADDAGAFAAAVAVLPNRATTLWARSTDAAGNASPCSTEGLTYVHDDVAPDAPELVATTPPSPARTGPALTLDGRAEPGARVAIAADATCGAPVATVDADEDGRWSAALTAAPNAATTYTATATDAAGNVSACGAPRVFVHDDRAPDPPVLDATQPPSPASDPRPRALGAAEVDATVIVYGDAACAGAPLASAVAAQGQVDVAFDAPRDRATTLGATATDAAGNTSGCAPGATYVHDGTPPAAPRWTGSTPASPTRASVRPMLAGVTDPGAVVRVFADPTCGASAAPEPVAEAVADAGGAFTVAVDVPANSRTTFAATATDAVGNASPCGDPLAYEHDDRAPDPPVLGPTVPASPSPEPQPDVPVAAEPGALVALFASPDCAGPPARTLTADAAGRATFAAVPVLANAATTLSATATDAVGNASACAAAVTYVHDDAAPAAPAMTGVDPVSPNKELHPRVAVAVDEPGLVVRVYRSADCSGAAVGTAALGPATAAAIPSDAAPNAPSAFRATATDAAGNTSACAATAALYVHDSAAPNPPYDLGTTPPVWSRTVSRPEVFGKAEPDMIVRVYADPLCIEPASVILAPDGAPEWSTAIELGPGDRDTAFAARAEDAAGNVSACSTPVPYRFDTSPPKAPVLAATDPASPSPATAFAVLGSAEPDATVALFDDAACASPLGASAVADPQGHFRVPMTAADGATLTLYATATDPSHSVSPCSSGITYTQDAVPPAPPTLDATLPTSPSDRETHPVVVGRAEPGAAVAIYTDDRCAGPVAETATAAGNGLFTAIVAVAPNALTTLYGTATDRAGNTSGCSPDGLRYLHDDTDPRPPTLAGTDPGSPGASLTPEVLGATEPLATVRLYLGAGCTGFLVGEVTADALGDWRVPIAVAANARTFLYGRALDLAGRASACTDPPLEYVHDSLAPAPPDVRGTAPGSPATARRPSVVGLAEASARIDLWCDPTCGDPAGASAAALADGTFAVAVDVAADAATDLWATATDAAGNRSDCSPRAARYVHDGQAPDAPTLTATRPASPASVQTPVVVGLAEPLATIELFADAACADAVLGTGAAAADGTFAVVAAVAPNVVTTLFAAATDAAGNRSACAAPGLDYLHDDSQPLVPRFTGTSPPSPSRDALTPHLLGVAEAGSAVWIYAAPECAGAVVATAATSPAGAFDAVATVAANTTTTFYARSYDLALNPSPCSPEGLTFVSDRQVPAPPTLAATTPPSPSATVLAPTVRGDAEPGATVALYLDSACAFAPTGATAVADASGAWSAAVTAAANATTTLYANATDPAGNASACSSGLPYTHDDRAPAPPVLTGTSPASPARALTPRALGTAEPGATIRVYATPDCTGSVIGQGLATAGAIDIAVGVGPDVATTLAATATDLAGNTSACGAALTYANDSTPPAVPRWTGSTPASPSRASTHPTLTGATDPDATVRLHAGATCAGSPAQTATADATGAFAFAVTVAADSTTSWSATAVDAVGNASACTSPALVYVHDQTAPAKPVVGPLTPASPSPDPRPDLALKSEPAATIHVYASADCSGPALATIAADGFGNAALADVAVTPNATTTLTAAATDPAGNTSACASAIAYTHDDVRPAPPVLTTTDPPSPSNVARPKVAGAVAEAGLLVRVYRSADCTGTVAGSLALGPASTFAIPSDALANATTSFRATATDAAGNTSTCSTAPIAYLHDNVLPAVPWAFTTAPVRWSRTVSKPTVSGKADADATVLVFGDVGCTPPALATVPADGAVDWSLELELGPGDRDVGLAFKARDAAGNVSGCSSGLPYRFDTTPPTFAGATAASLGLDATKQVNVTWSYAADNFTTSAHLVYTVCLSRRCGAADCDFAAVAPPGGPAYSVTAEGVASAALSDLAPNTRYYVKVRARDQLGNQEANDKVVSVKTKGLTAAMDLAVGETAASLRLSDGTRVSWGPGAIPTNLTDPVQLSLGASHSCALERAGTVRCWGDNSYGQLGNGTTAASTATSVAVTGLANAVAVDVGLESTCALLATGQVACWGRDDKGQLGRGAGNDSQKAPVTVVTDLAGTALIDAWRLAVGDRHACAARADGAVLCWGSNGYGELGREGEQVEVASPSAASDVVDLVAGQEHVCAIAASGAVLCWGGNGSGQLGDGLAPTRAWEPHAVLGVAGAVALGTSRLHTCAAQADGALYCWGKNASGELGGRAASVYEALPVAVVGLAGVVQVGGGEGFTCARLVDGSARCWGSGQGGRLGTGTTASSLAPALVTQPVTLAGVALPSIDHEHGCALTVDGLAACWGRNTSGQLGHGETGPDAAPLATVLAAGRARAVATGGQHSCLVTEDGAVLCWGAGAAGQLGDGLAAASATPVAVVGLADAKAVALGDLTSCALGADSAVRCWGDNTAERLGVGPGAAATARPVAGLARGVRSLAVGAGHQCAVDLGGAVACWGRNDAGQVDGAAAPGAVVAAPRAVEGVVGAVQVVAGGAHSCALLADGTARCWGDNTTTQLGVNGAGAGVQAVAGLTGAVALSAGARTTCALKGNGVLACWGSNAAGAVGNGTATATYASPQAVSVPAAPHNRVVAMSQGDDDGCLATSTGLAYCWGDNDATALGTGAAEASDARVPTAVLCLP